MNQPVAECCDEGLLDQPVVLRGKLVTKALPVTTESRWQGDPFGLSSPRPDLSLRTGSGELVVLRGDVEIIAGSRERRTRTRFEALTMTQLPVVERAVVDGDTVLAAGRLSWTSATTGGYRENAGAWSLVPSAPDGSVQICSVDSPVLGSISLDRRLFGTVAAAMVSFVALVVLVGVFERDLPMAPVEVARGPCGERLSSHHIVCCWGRGPASILTAHHGALHPRLARQVWAPSSDGCAQANIAYDYDALAYDYDALYDRWDWSSDVDALYGPNDPTRQLPCEPRDPLSTGARRRKPRPSVSF